MGRKKWGITQGSISIKVDRLQRGGGGEKGLPFTSERRLKTESWKLYRALHSMKPFHNLQPPEHNNQSIFPFLWIKWLCSKWVISNNRVEPDLHCPSLEALFTIQCCRILLFLKAPNYKSQIPHPANVSFVCYQFFIQQTQNKRKLQWRYKHKHVF